MSSFQIKNHPFYAKDVEAALYIAATPIGNLGDVTLRTLETLAGCDLIACEDTRVTGKLLRHFSIETKTISYNEHNAEKSGARILEDLSAGKSVTLVSDAGTPLVSDPGFRLVKAARDKHIKVVPLPGASAPLAALVGSGLDTKSFLFLGFLPSKQGMRLKALEAHETQQATLVFFESPNRLVKSIRDMIEVFGPERNAIVARELTKLYEEFAQGTLQSLLDDFQNRDVKGEIVILIEGLPESAEIDVDLLLTELLQRMSVSKAAAEAVELTGLSKRELYQRALALKEHAS